jgi:hypothetical protein
VVAASGLRFRIIKTAVSSAGPRDDDSGPAPVTPLQTKLGSKLHSSYDPPTRFNRKPQGGDVVILYTRFT